MSLVDRILQTWRRLRHFQHAKQRIFSAVSLCCLAFELPKDAASRIHFDLSPTRTSRPPGFVSKNRRFPILNDNDANRPLNHRKPNNRTTESVAEYSHFLQSLEDCLRKSVLGLYGTDSVQIDER